MKRRCESERRRGAGETNVKTVYGRAMSVAAAALLLIGMRDGMLLAQTANAPAGSSIHGKVINAAGYPVTEGDVKLTQDTGKNTDFRYKFTFPIQPDGTYKGTGIPEGEWTIVAFTGGKSVDFQLNVNLKAFEDKVVDFDMTRKDYIDKMTPEEKAAIEEYKKKIASTMAANAKIQNLNALLNQARADNKSGNYAAAMKSMTDATAAKPEEPVLWVTLGDAQLGSADAAAGSPDGNVADEFGMDARASRETAAPREAAPREEVRPRRLAPAAPGDRDRDLRHDEQDPPGRGRTPRPAPQVRQVPQAQDRLPRP